MGDGSWIRIINYNNTLNDFRSWYPVGHFINTAQGDLIDAFCDTTDKTLVNIYKYGTQAITGFAVYVAVSVKIANAAYYAGVIYALPNMTLEYDNGTVSAAVAAAASTAQQQIFKVVTPASDNNELRVKLNQMTDASMANSQVTWNTIQINVRKYGYIFQSITTIIQQTLDTIQNVLTTPAVNPFITEATASTVAAYTGIAINHATQTLTITGNHSIQEVYDYTQYNLALEANMGHPEWLTTIDGIKYVCAYDVVVDGCVLSGAGKAINLGAKDFTTPNGGSTSLQVTDVDGTLTNITFTGLVATSEVRMYKASDMTEYSGGTESCGTSHTFNYNHTVDVEVIVVVLNNDYEEMWVEGIILTSSPQSIPVSQRRDRVYASA
jgi:hypothetical protein